MAAPHAALTASGGAEWIREQSGIVAAGSMKSAVDCFRVTNRSQAEEKRQRRVDGGQLGLPNRLAVPSGVLPFGCADEPAHQLGRPGVLQFLFADE